MGKLIPHEGRQRGERLSFILAVDDQLTGVAFQGIRADDGQRAFGVSPVSPRRFRHSIAAIKRLHSVSTRLAGRACTPLGKSHINSMTRAIAFLLSNPLFPQKVMKEEARD
jgi:hypothetical protein